MTPSKPTPLPRRSPSYIFLKIYILKFECVFFLNFQSFEASKRICVSIFIILKQVPETTEEVRQRTLREAAAEKAGEVIQYTKEKVEKNYKKLKNYKKFKNN